MDNLKRQSEGSPYGPEAQSKHGFDPEMTEDELEEADCAPNGVVTANLTAAEAIESGIAKVFPDLFDGDEWAEGVVGTSGRVAFTSHR